ncbi:haloacid dehalogenase type II [Phycicoccus endophyticus]|uniref:Haloacid dehalogenase type II n=1 Tax=Phycicoccus endophyticus TaxID=1690220 RepID=A0A7G9R1Q3_9MICO|nr:haloacid dehalogenase type II [Phycicoccus endophyticus]NHI18680.1 haloacid dehalogenase type II [Phycicoccus endophyticus]QNN49528.1 haloacid dehalogenase type II [Phycicoccus endophyticus]GGL37297.1 dehalogenase [Phycicoccus endophyticus]
MSHPRAPQLLVLDVNETLSDMTPVRARFAEVGLPEHLAATWFAGLLRDGMALTVTGDNPSFAELARASFGSLAATTPAAPADVQRAADAVLETFMALPLHPDVEPGLRALAARGIRLVTLSNGASAVAEGLLGRAGLDGLVEHVLSVADAPRWKPDASAYRYALEVCGVEPAAAMLVAVHPWDTHGAVSAGLQAAYVDRLGVPYPATMRPPTLTVGSLTELAERLGG